MLQLRMFFRQFLMGLKLFLRVPAAIFWIIAFPMLMLLGLGAAFGGKTDVGAKLVWARAAPASGTDTYLQQALGERVAKLEIVTSAEGESRWREGKLPVLLEGQGGRYSLRVNSYLRAQGTQFEALVQQAFLVAQARAEGAPEPASIPVVLGSPGGRHEGPYAAYLLPGLLGLNVLMMGVFSAGIVDVQMREKGGYKRLATTPLPRYIYLGAQVCVRLVVVIAATVMLMLAGAVAFGIHNQGSLISVLILQMLGATCFISLGYVLASFARSVEAYSGISNIVFLVLMLVSGVYFSLDAAPLWFQRGAEFLPLAPLLSALRAVFNDGSSLNGQGAALLLVGGWTVLLFILASRRFKWV
jgi:ABC-type multidrug transport system permease subunit